VPRGVRSVKDYLVWCRANPAKATFGTTSAGGTPHFVGVMLAEHRVSHSALCTIAEGRPRCRIFSAVISPLPSTRSAKCSPMRSPISVRILAVTGAQRSPFLPDVPTMQEADFRLS